MTSDDKSNRALRGYRFKLYPSAEQRVELERQCHMVGSLWNAMLSQVELAGEGIYRPLNECFAGPPLIEGESRDDRRTRLDTERRAQQARQKTAREAGTNIPWGARAKKAPGRLSLSHELTVLYDAEPAWRALSTWTGRCVADSLGLAFQAFFRRAKAGAGASSGYPKYRPYARQNWLPHLFRSGCRLEHVQGNTWRLALKGIDGPIHARGQLPRGALAWVRASIRHEAGAWWLSASAELPPRETHDTVRTPVQIELNCIDYLARVDGRPVHAFELGLRDNPRIPALQTRLSELAHGSEERGAMRLALARACAKQARVRREALHEWTTALVRRASEIRLTVPAKIQHNTATGAGDATEWGAATRAKATFNRAVLSQAPALAIHMIKYKAAEAGVPLTVIEHDVLAPGNLMVATRRAARSVRRALKEMT